ncbi:hypothetical protein LZL87_013762 [Fusarium oxysporum]|nr:hypothetical protein LZL87_013762 [Fusarium oxysporum]
MTLLAAPPTAGAVANKSAAPLSGRLKGKVRKEAKQQQKQHIAPLGIDKKDTPDPPPKPKYMLAIRDFVPLAEFIACKLITITSEAKCIFAFTALLKDLIKLRKEIHYAHVLLHQTSVRYAAKPGAVLHAVQLYTAVHQQQQQQQEEEEEKEEHLVPVPEWPDLDCLVAMQGLQAFFVGTEPPASLQAHFKNYCMSRGISPANWLAAANRRKGKYGKVLLQRSRAGIRELKFRAPISLCYTARIEKRAIAEPTRRAWNAEQEEQAKKDGVAETEFQAGAAADRKIKAKAKAAPAHPTLTAPQLVHYVAYAIQTEMPDLVFDYFAMHKMARGLLEKVQAQADDISLPLMSYVTTDIADIAGLVFAIAAKEMASKSGQSQGVLSKVAMVIRE